MFRGASQIALDSKGRIAIPKRYRESLASRADGHLVATVGRECLPIYPLPDWEEVERKLMALPNINPAARRLQRIMMGYAKDLKMDPQGRVLLPKELRETANLDEPKRVVLVGQGNKFELWDEGIWNTQRDEWLAADPGEVLNVPPELESLSL